MLLGNAIVGQLRPVEEEKITGFLCRGMRAFITQLRSKPRKAEQIIRKPLMDTDAE